MDLPIIMCVGSSKFLQDSVGPMVGDFLKAQNLPAFVYGDSTNNIDATNLIEKYLYIKAKHKHNNILVVDSGLCFEKDYKSIIAQNKGIKSLSNQTFLFGDKSLVAYTYCVDKQLALTKDEIICFAKKISLFLKRYINFKIQIT